MRFELPLDERDVATAKKATEVTAFYGPKGGLRRLDYNTDPVSHVCDSRPPNILAAMMEIMRENGTPIREATLPRKRRTP